jgi:hypothetical protein
MVVQDFPRMGRPLLVGRGQGWNRSILLLRMRKESRMGLVRLINCGTGTPSKTLAIEDDQLNTMFTTMNQKPATTAAEAVHRVLYPCFYCVGPKSREINGSFICAECGIR